MSNQQSNPQRNPDIYQGIKLFEFGQSNYINWALKPINKNNAINKGISPLIPKTNKYPVYLPNDLIVDGNIYSNGHIYSNVYTLSDERLKDNIEMIDDSELFTLNPIIFTYKNNKNKKKHFGLLAQDVEKVYPELVEINNTGYKSVNYQELIPIMLSKMKKMQKEIDELKEKL
jgi:hypothetical protein